MSIKEFETFGVTKNFRAPFAYPTTTLLDQLNAFFMLFPYLHSMDDVGVKSSGSSTPGGLEDNINVVVRVRPLSDKELKSNDDSAVQFPGNGQIMVSDVPLSGGITLTRR